MTLWAYAAYADHSRSWARYGLVIVLFIVGLMAKPMLVTLPVLLLLLDYWPLGRWTVDAWTRGQEGAERTASISGDRSTVHRGSVRLPSGLVVEKIPLVVLAVASSAVTVIAQRGAMKVIDTITFPMRLENALVSYAAYIGEIFYPVNLAPLYPFPEHGVPWPNIAVAVLVLAAITALVVRLRAWRWLAVGWLWYLVALLPVIGLVQVGVQAMADRYTYLPHIGLYIMLAWTAEELTANLPLRRWFWTAALVLLIPVLILVDCGPDGDLERQRDPLDQCPEGQSRNRPGREQSGVHHADPEARSDEAFKRYQHAVEIRPRYVEAHINLGNMYMHKGQTDEGMKHYRTAIEIRPDFEQSYVNLGTGTDGPRRACRGRGQLSHGLGKGSPVRGGVLEVGRSFYAGRRSSRRESPHSARRSKLPPTTTRRGRRWPKRWPTTRSVATRRSSATTFSCSNRQLPAKRQKRSATSIMSNVSRRKPWSTGRDSSTTIPIRCPCSR